MTETKPEFSRPVRVGEVGKGGLEYTIEADAAECEAVARRLGVVAVEELRADLVVKRWRRMGARLNAHITGQMTRRCVVTLEDFVVPIDEQIEVRYADPADEIAMGDTDGELILEPGSEEPPEVLERGGFDAGEAVVQHLVLGLDPYPRKPGAQFADVNEKVEKPSPFAVLSVLKNDEKDGDSGD